MQKPIIIIGQPESGKSFLADQLSLIYNNVFYISGRSTRFTDDSFPFRGLTQMHDLIIIDDVQSFFSIKHLMECNIIEVIQPYTRNFLIQPPQIIITLHETQHIQEIKGNAGDNYNVIECEILDGIFNYTKLPTAKSQKA